MTRLVYPAPRWRDMAGRWRTPQVTSGFHERRIVQGSQPRRYYYHSGSDVMYQARPGGDDPPWTGRYTRHRSRAFVCPAGLPALAVGPGVIDWMGDYIHTGLGVTLRLAAGGVWLYAHCDLARRIVTVGQRVAAGEPVAVISGSPPGGIVHLHCEDWIDGKPGHRVDPAVRLRGAVVVDLPAGWTPGWDE